MSFALKTYSNLNDGGFENNLNLSDNYLTWIQKVGGKSFKKIHINPLVLMINKQIE